MVGGILLLVGLAARRMWQGPPDATRTATNSIEAAVLESARQLSTLESGTAEAG